MSRIMQFLTDVLDRSVICEEDFKSFVDIATPSIRYDHLLCSMAFCRTVAISLLWYRFFQVYPSKLDVLRFVCTTGIETDAGYRHLYLEPLLQKLIGYLMGHTLFKHTMTLDAKTSEQIIDQITRQALQITSNIPSARQWLLRKWADRFDKPALASSVPEVADASLYSLYTRFCVPGLCFSGEAPAEATLSESSIREHVAKNRITGGWHQGLLETYQANADLYKSMILNSSLLEFQQHVVCHDAYFMRWLFQTDVVWISKGWEDVPHYVNILLDGLNASHPTRQLTVLYESAHIENIFQKQKPYYMKVAYGISQHCLNHLPKVSQRFYACLSEDSLVPAMPLGRDGPSQNRCVFISPQAAHKALSTSQASQASQWVKNYDHAMVLYTPDQQSEIRALHAFAESISGDLHVYGVPVPASRYMGPSFPTPYPNGSIGALLHSPDYAQYVLQTSAKLQCPFRAFHASKTAPKTTAYNYLYVLDALQLYAYARGKDFLSFSYKPPPAMPIASGCDHVVVLVDSRASVMSALSCLITLANLDASKWMLRIVTDEYITYASYFGWDLTSSSAGTYADSYMQIFPTHPDLRSKKFTVEDYTYLLKQASFWKLLDPFKKCLIIQDDAMLLRKDAQQAIHHTYQKYDYVGAPWLRDVPSNIPLLKYANPEMVGNGGLSYRTVAVMQRICETRADHVNDVFHTGLQTDPEDVFFSRYVHLDGYALCPERHAIEFSSEEVLHLDTQTGSEKPSLGIHKCWAYHTIDKIQKYFDLYCKYV